MLSFLKHPLIRSVVYAGIKPDMSLDLSLRIQLTNISAIVAISSNITFSIMFLLMDTMGTWLIPLINAPFAFTVGYCIYLNHKGHIQVAKYVILFCVSMVVFLTSFFFYGNLLGAHYFFLLFSALPFMILSYKERYSILIYFLINLTLFYYIGYVHVPPLLSPQSPFYNIEVREVFVIVSTITCFFILAIFLLYFLRNTERNQEELVKANHYKDLIFSILAHDLKGPIGSMGTYLGILTENRSKMSDEMIDRGLIELKKNANQSYVVLENLLEWGRKETNRLLFQPESTLLTPLLQETESLFRIQCKEKKMEWLNEFFFEERVFIDSRMMSTILRNIFSNAIKFSNPEGKIIVSSKDLGKFVELSITDFGTGMSQEKLDSILNGSTIKSDFGTMGERGTGLGMVVTLQLLSVHNIPFFISSEKNKGTKVTMHLPKPI
ncbi:MAG: HAMP domain-containing sensor histidine kinase [Leptospira sp.]|nr:HAMP domain-containing sensor histidine kinase [Leptospira sp.]